MGVSIQVQQSITDFSKFSQLVKLKAFCVGVWFWF